ncbi:DUF1934 domain-containing protein [Caldicellulosiruptoraceae bacterium PP1]
MKQDALIKVTGTQEYPLMDYQNKIEFFTEGKYYKKGKTYYITYKESELTGLNGTTTTFKIQNDFVTLIRFGDISSTLVFEPGKRHVSMYSTDEGVITVGVYTKKMQVDLNDNGGIVFVEYSIDFDASQMSNNDFYLEIKKVGAKN